MDFEPSKHEPEEYDPEAEFRDPDSDSITIPEVSVPEPGAYESDVPAAIQTSFWLLVFVIKAALIATSLGVLFLAFGFDQTLGATFLGGGLLLFALAVRRYHAVDLSALSTDGGDTDDHDDGDIGDDRDTDNSTENSVTAATDADPEPDDDPTTPNERTDP